MTTFERGTRVQHIYEAHNPYSNHLGTVTHLHGDEPTPQHPDGFDERDDGTVWVQFDNSEECWIKTKFLVRIA